MTGRFRLHLAKEDFKFSAAHFTLFSPNTAEALHGHNYRLEMEVEGARLDEFGFLAEFSTLKKAARALCASLDEKILLPGTSPHLAVVEGEEGVKIEFADRAYLFPRAEVVWLPVPNITVESLCRWSWGQLAAVMRGLPVQKMTVHVAETMGQGASYEAELVGGVDSV